MKYLLSIILFVSISVKSSEQFETKSHEQIFKQIKSLLNEVASSEILVVYDIDNTILAMNTNFGSDQWFNWQKNILGNKEQGSIASSFQELLKIQYQIFAIEGMHLTENRLITIFRDIQHTGIKTIALLFSGPNA